MPKPTRLVPKSLTEISLCAKGANPESNVVIFKRDSSSEADTRAASASEADAADRHMQEAHSDLEVEKASEASPSDSEELGMSCPECGTALELDKFGMNRHMAKEHHKKSAIVKAATKTENGQSFPKSAYAYTPDDEPSHWKLRTWASPSEKETPGQVGAAVAALGKGFRGNKVDIPSDAMAGVKAKVRSAWKKVNSDKDASDMPPVLKSALPLGMRVIAKFSGTDTEEMRKSFEAEEEAQAVEEIEKDQLVYIDDDDDLVYDLQQLLGMVPPEGTDEPSEHSAGDEGDGYVNVSGPLPKEQLAGALMALGKIEKAGKKMSSSRLNRLKDAHYALGGLISEVDEGSSPDGDSQAEPPPKADPEQSKEKKNVTKIDKTELSPEVLQYIEGLEKKADEAMDAEAPEDVFKNLDPKAAEIMKSEIAKREALEAEVRKMREERERADAIKKASEFRFLPGTPEARADMLLSISKSAGPEVADALIAEWSSTNQALMEGDLFSEIGKTNSGPSGSTALDALNAAGAEIRKSNVDLSAEQAFVKAVEQNPELHRQYEAEQTRRLLSGGA